MKKLIAMMLSALLVLCAVVMPAAAQEAEDCLTAEAVTAEKAEELLISCTGYEGTAGSSLKGAIAAQRVLTFCIENDLIQTETEAFLQTLGTAYQVMTDEQREEFDRNMKSIIHLLDSAFADYPSVEGLFDSAGILQSMKLLLETENAYGHYVMFKVPMMRVMGMFDEMLLSCTGYAGTAGSSLKNAVAAYEMLNFFIEYDLSYAEPITRADAFAAAYAALDEERTAELALNMESIARLLEKAFADYALVEGVFDSAGITEDMQLLLSAEDAYDDWKTLELQMNAILVNAGQ